MGALFKLSLLNLNFFCWNIIVIRSLRSWKPAWPTCRSGWMCCARSARSCCYASKPWPPSVRRHSWQIAKPKICCKIERNTQQNKSQQHKTHPPHGLISPYPAIGPWPIRERPIANPRRCILRGYPFHRFDSAIRPLSPPLAFPSHRGLRRT